MEVTITGLRYNVAKNCEDKDEAVERFLSEQKPGDAYLLQPEPDNAFDPCAVAVYLGMNKIGYVEHSTATYIMMEHRDALPNMCFFLEGEHVTMWADFPALCEPQLIMPKLNLLEVQPFFDFRFIRYTAPDSRKRLDVVAYRFQRWQMKENNIDELEDFCEIIHAEVNKSLSYEYGFIRLFVGMRLRRFLKQATEEKMPEEYLERLKKLIHKTNEICGDTKVKKGHEKLFNAVLAEMKEEAEKENNLWHKYKLNTFTDEESLDSEESIIRNIEKIKDWLKSLPSIGPAYLKGDISEAANFMAYARLSESSFNEIMSVIVVYEKLLSLLEKRKDNLARISVRMTKHIQTEDVPSLGVLSSKQPELLLPAVSSAIPQAAEVMKEESADKRYSIVVKPCIADSFIELLNGYSEGKTSPKDLMRPVRAAVDAGVITRVSLHVFQEVFPLYKQISKSSYNNYLTPNTLPNCYKDEGAYNEMVEAFKNLLKK